MGRKRVQHIGKINLEPLEKEFGKLQTDNVVLTEERMLHIKQGHPDDYNLFQQYKKEMIEDPDLILKEARMIILCFL